VDKRKEIGRTEVQREQRLQLEEQRLQRQLKDRRWQLEERKWQERKEFEQRKWREELELKKNEQKHRESTAVKVKTWGDALRNVICKMPNESTEVVSWFMSVEKLFDRLKVPEELQAVLVRPYLSERAKLLR